MNNNDFKFFGQKIAVLLDKSTLPNDVKEAWIQLISEMKIEQLDRFLNILEREYLDRETGYIDERYQETIKEVMNKYFFNYEKNKRNLLSNLQQLEKVYE
jgi:hypothetical protein